MCSLSRLSMPPRASFYCGVRGIQSDRQKNVEVAEEINLFMIIHLFSQKGFVYYAYLVSCCGFYIRRSLFAGKMPSLIFSSAEPCQYLGMIRASTMGSRLSSQSSHIFGLLISRNPYKTCKKYGLCLIKQHLYGREKKKRKEV